MDPTLAEIAQLRQQKQNQVQEMEEWNTKHNNKLKELGELMPKIVTAHANTARENAEHRRQLGPLKKRLDSVKELRNRLRETLKKVITLLEKKERGQGFAHEFSLLGSEVHDLLHISDDTENESGISGMQSNETGEQTGEADEWNGSDDTADEDVISNMQSNETVEQTVEADEGNDRPRRSTRVTKPSKFCGADWIRK